MPNLAHPKKQETGSSNPLDLAEQVIAANEWAFERRSHTELAAETRGSWCDYGLYFCWSNEVSILHFSVSFDIKAPAQCHEILPELLLKANERLWIGSFGVDEENGMPIYRHAMLLRGIPTASLEAIEDLIDIAITECERFFPAFQFALWGGKNAEEALDAAMLECVGEA